MKRLFLTIAIALVMLALVVPPVFAQTAEPTVVTGVVNAVSQETGTVTVDINGSLVAFIAPAGFDFTSVAVGDTVTVSYTTDENGVVTVQEILKVVDEPTPEPTQDPTEEPTEVPTPEPVQVTGTVTAFSEVDGTVTIEVETVDGDQTTVETYVVVVPAGFDFTALHVGDSLDVTMTQDATTGAWTATAIVVTPAEEEQEITGKIVAFSEVDGTITVELEDGTQVVITVPEGFDFTNLKAGDSITALVTEDADGNLVASEISVTPAEEEEEDQPATRNPAYCSQFGYTDENGDTVEPTDGEVAPTGKQHPVGLKIAATYGVTYEEVMGYFCHGAGFGQIMLALQTQEVTQTPAADLLAMKKEQGGWGQVWHSLGIFKNPKHAQPPVDDETGQPTEEPTVAPTDESTVEPTEEATVEAQQLNGNGNNNGNGNGNGKKETLQETQQPQNQGHMKQYVRPTKAPKSNNGKH